MLQQGLESRSSLIKEKQKKLILTKKQDVKKRRKDIQKKIPTAASLLKIEKMKQRYIKTIQQMLINRLTLLLEAMWWIMPVMPENEATSSQNRSITYTAELMMLVM